MKKVILLIISILLLTGCSANSTIKINDNNVVNEKVVITENRSNLHEGNIDEYVKNLVDANGLNDYKYTVKKQGLYVIVTFKKDHKNVCEYLDNSFFVKFVSSSYSCTKDSGEYFIRYSIRNKKCTDCLEEEDDVTVKYNLSKKNVLKNNADKSNEGFYQWEFSSDDNRNITLRVKKHITISDFSTPLKVLLAIIPVALVVLIVRFFKKKYENNKISY